MKVTNLVRGAQYTCNVRALSVLGTGALSDDVTATTFNLPGGPRGIAAAALSKTIKLTYLAPASSGGARVTKLGSAH